MAGGVDLDEGTLIGDDFEIVERLGEGGMGVVYAAQQRSTGRLRALKVMAERIDEDARLEERFMREAQIGAIIRSPHVVDVIAAGIDRGRPWIAMELLEGEDLHDHVTSRGALAPSEVARLVEQLADAIGAAHDAEIVHRDLKPENLFVTGPAEAGGEPVLKVLDFGIARFSAQARSGATTAIGSPAWMAPEQADPHEGITPRTDVWAIGLVVFFMLTGHPYWRSLDVEQVSLHAVMKEILFEPLCLASERAGEVDDAPTLPPGFDAWFARSVARDPDDRYADARTQCETFLRLLEGEVPAVPSRMLPRRRSPGAAAGLVVALIAAGGGGLLALRARQPPPATMAAGLPQPTVVPPAPVPTSSANATADTSASPPDASAEPTATAIAAPRPPPPPREPPFDRAKAQAVLRAKENLSGNACGMRMGDEKTVQGTVTYDNSGRVAKVEFHGPRAKHLGRRFCVRTFIQSAKIPPFSGPSTPLPFAVSFPD